MGWKVEGGMKHCACVCVCVSMHSHTCDAVNLSFCHLPLATTACNRPSAKARQLTIRGGGGGCGMGDYARGLVSYTITSHVADRLASWCVSTALCLLVCAHRLEHTQREEQAAALWYSPKTGGKTK